MPTRLPARASRRRVPALTHDPSPLFQSPEAVGPYRVRRVLASGTLGPRLLVEDPRGRLQVLKLITDVGSDGPALAEVLEHVRAQVPAHPGLLPVTEVGLADEGVYLASPLLDDPTVEGRLHGGRQTLDATLSWLRTVAAGLQAAHEAGVWHGAIHPRDVLVTDEGGVLTGVGVAPALEHLSMQAPVRVPYTAPERASGRPWDARADQYSLAMLALDALSGRRLIAGTIPAFDRWTLAETPTEDARLHEVFVRALHPDPDQRYASLDDWFSALAGPDRAGAQGALSRFAREGVILATPAAAAAATSDAGRDIEVQHLEDPEGVALSLFPEEDATSESPAVESVAATDLPSGEEPEQEWLVADVPEEVVAAPEPEPLVYRAPPTEYPTIDAPSVGTPPQAEWRLDDEEPPTPTAEPPRTWDTQPDESSGRGVWVLVIALLVLAALGYGTWTSLQTPMAPEDAPQVAAAPEAEEPPAPAASVPTTETPESSAPVAPERVVPQAPVPASPAEPAAARPVPGPPPVARPETPSPAAPEVIGTGRALIRSSPSGEVRVNGRVRGETPVVLRDLPYGSYVVSISRPGFQTVERELTLLASQPVASLTVDLVRGEGTAPPPPAPEASAPVADTRPAPPSSPSPSAATPATPSTSPAAPAPAASTPAGRPAGAVGSIFVVSTPASARLYVDGQLYGSTPAAIPGLTPGMHTVRVEARGYRAWEGQVHVVPGTRVRVQATLQQEQE